MAHFAKLDENNTVVDVIVVNNDVLIDEGGIEREEKGIAFLIEWSGGCANWKQTSFNARIRKNFGAVGFRYDATRDAFIAPQPFESWLLDDETCQWAPPVPYPTDGKPYRWDEENVSWSEIEIKERQGR